MAEMAVRSRYDKDIDKRIRKSKIVTAMLRKSQ